MWKWKTFYFSSDLARGFVNSRSDWLRIISKYEKAAQYQDDKAIKNLKKALSCQSPSYKLFGGGCPHFGFYMEFTNPPALGDWAEENGMNLEIKPWPKLKTAIKILAKLNWSFIKHCFNP